MPPAAPKDDIAQRFLAAVESKIGDPYAWGATGPDAFDCSGLVWWAGRQVGINLPRTTTEQYARLKHISADQVQPGDLVYLEGSDPPSPGHVGVVDKTGTTFSMIDAPFTGADVRQDSFSVPGQGDMRVVGFARLPGVKGGGTSSGGGGGGGGSIFSIPGEVVNFFAAAESFVKAAMWILNPENWVRILAGLGGVLLGIAGFLFLMRAA